MLILKIKKTSLIKLGKNYSWNNEGALTGPGSGGELVPHYWDNPYWTRYKNYQSDERNRFFGNVFATLEINDWLSVTAKGAVDTYNELREERRAIGSVATEFGILRDDEGSGYDKVDILFSEYNYDLMFNVNKQISDNLSLNGVFGINVRKESYGLLKKFYSWWFSNS